MAISLTRRFATHRKASNREIICIHYKQVSKADSSLGIAASKEHSCITEGDEGVPKDRHRGQRATHRKPFNSIED